MSAPTTPLRHNSSGGLHSPYHPKGGTPFPQANTTPLQDGICIIQATYHLLDSTLRRRDNTPLQQGNTYPHHMMLCPYSVAETEVTAPSQTAQVDYALEASRLVIETLHNIESMVGIPYLNEAAGVALRILTIVQSRRQEFTDLANDACGLVYTIVIECQGMMQNRQQVPEGIQVHIAALVRNLSEIEKFSRQKLKRLFLQKLIHHTKDIDEVTRYRTLLRQSLDKFGIQSSISIQRNLQPVLKNLEKQRDDLNSARESRRIATRLEQDQETKRLEAALRAECDTGKKRKRVKRAERQRKKEEDSPKRLKTVNGHHPQENNSLYPALDRRAPNPRPHSYDDLFPRPVYLSPSFSYSHLICIEDSMVEEFLDGCTSREEIGFYQGRRPVENEHTLEAGAPSSLSALVIDSCEKLTLKRVNLHVTNHQRFDEHRVWVLRKSIKAPIRSIQATPRFIHPAFSLACASAKRLYGAQDSVAVTYFMVESIIANPRWKRVPFPGTTRGMGR